MVVQLLKNPPANEGDTRDTGLILVLERSPRVGNGNPLQYSCLENPMNRGTWLATVHGVAELDVIEHTGPCSCPHTPLTSTPLSDLKLLGDKMKQVNQIIPKLVSFLFLI